MSGEAAAAHVAIVGSGPSGFYAAEALMKADPGLRVDMLERLPTPFGLVRGGVAPDHPKIKQVALVYDRIARNPRFRFFGNVELGADVSVARLRDAYHALVLACGAPVDAPLGIPGESLPGSHAAGDFVGWYNGHPDHSHRTFDLSHEVAVVIGHGNVASDICRMLAMPASALAATDAASHAVEALAASRVREIHVIGRRGPAQAKFTENELRELGAIDGCDALVEPADLELNAASSAEVEDRRGVDAARIVKIFREFPRGPSGAPRRLRFRFLESPVRINGDGRVQSVTLARSRLEGAAFAQRPVATGERAELVCGLVFRCVGFRANPLPGLPFDASRGVVPNRAGRVIDADGPLAGVYAAGWVKRGASGIIGTNRADSGETVRALLEDLAALRTRRVPGTAGLQALLAARGKPVVDYAGWLRLDAVEVSRGRASGKPREKIVDVARMLDAARETVSETQGVTA
ncbi:MAG: NAD(P)-binding protein [Burkholderiales bacterium]